MSAPANSSAILGVGMALGYSTLPLADPPVYLAFSKIVDITPPKKQRKSVETTNNDDTDRKEEFIPGFSGVSDPTLTLIYQKAWAAFLDTTYEAATVLGFQITFPDGSTVPFSDISELGEATPLKDKITQDVTLKIVDSTAAFTAGS